MPISTKAIQSIKNNINVKARLMIAFHRDSRSVELWFKKNSLQLTTPQAIAIIKEETGLTDSEILTENATV